MINHIKKLFDGTLVAFLLLLFFLVLACGAVCVLASLPVQVKPIGFDGDYTPEHRDKMNGYAQ